MDRPELFFFCAMCPEDPQGGFGRAGCAIPHTVRTYAKGEYIAYQGDEVAHLYILTKGRVKTEIVSEPGLTLHIDDITAPYPLAAAFLFAADSRFPVDVIAQQECEAILIRKEEVEKQMALCPGFLRGFLAFTADRTRFLSERLKIFSLKGIKTKVAFYILQRAVDGEFEMGRSISSLAEYFGVERPSLSRAISEMVRDGAIEYSAGKGRITDPKALKEML